MQEPETHPSPPAGPEALEDLTLRAAEFSEYVGSYLRAQKDKVAYSLRRVVVGLILGIFLVLFLAGVLIAAIACLFYGATLGIKEWVGKEWIAFLISGGGTLLILGLFLKFGLLGRKKKGLETGLRNYEEELRHQHERFGHDATERAAQWTKR